MTTVTRRLRRASVAGLAALATAGGAVIASGGSAWAFQSSGGGGFNTVTAATVFPGMNSQALPSVTLNLPDASGGGWVAGDFLTFTLATDAAGTPLCTTSSNLNDWASLAQPTVSAADGSTAFTGFTVSQSSSGTCNVKDQFTIALTAGAPNDGNSTAFTISGLSLSLGSGIASGTTVYLSVKASNGKPFGTTASDQTSVQVATVGNVTVSASPVVGVASSTSAVTVSISPIVVTDVVGGAINSQIQFKLPSDAFQTAGTLSAPTGVTVSAPSETLPASTLTYTITGNVPAGGKFTLTGASVNLAANSTGAHTVQVWSGSPLAQVGNSAEIAVNANQDRVAGFDRYATAAQAFGKPGCPRQIAVVASGLSYADALSASVLAAANNTGVLLTDPNTLPSSTQQELITCGVSTVYIVGGTAAVSSNVESAIAALHVGNNPSNPLITVVRVAGSDRYATNEDVNLMSSPTGGWAVVATGTNFADALAVSPVVYAEHYALVLTDPNTLSASAQDTLVNLGIKNVVIVGGTSAVSSTVETAIKGLNGGITVYRVAGSDRTATAAQIATWVTAGLPAANGYGALTSVAPFNVAANEASFYLARGDLAADALSIGPLAGLQGHVLLLAANPTTLGPGAPTYLAGKAATITTITAVGYAAAVSPSVLNAATAALG